MQFLSKFLILALCLVPMGTSEAKGFEPFFKHRGLIAAWAVVLYSASLVTGREAIKRTERVVEKTTSVPKGKAAKDTYKTVWLKFGYLPTAFVGAFLVNRYAHRIPGVGDRASWFGLSTAADYAEPLK